MPSQFSLFCSTLALAAFAGTTIRPAQAQPKTQPNIIFVLADDLGYGDIGVFHQNARRAANDRSRPAHFTPNLDIMAAQGIQIPQHYCSSPVCAPSRASFLLGVHQGHANVRDNQFDKVLEDNYTLPRVLKQAGYATACIGKWGLQGEESPNQPNGFASHPQNRGFDAYFGYIPHAAGHAHYPKEDGKRLFDGSKNVVAAYDGCYTTDLFTARAKKWITEQETVKPKQPFFLYLAYDTPHAKLEYPPCPFPTGGGSRGGVQWLGTPGHMINTADGKPDSYCHPDYVTATWDDDKNPVTPKKTWPDVYKRYATDVRRIDDCVGDLLTLLKDLKIDSNTLVVFTSDNGPSQESYLPENNEANFFGSFGPFDGIKRDLWEGGIRVGAIARWPGRVAAGRVSPTPSAFWDWMPTFSEVAGLPAPARSDGVSLLPTLQGRGTQNPSRLYFEYSVAGKTPAYPEFAPAHQGRVRQQMQALRLGDYIGVRYNIASHADQFEIYNIIKDPQETNNLAKDPKFAALQQQLHDTVLGLRRPDTDAPRPYDDEFVPSVTPEHTTKGLTWNAIQQPAPWVAQTTALKPLSTGLTPRLLWPKLSPQANEIQFSGFIEVPKDGDYTFSLSTSSKALLRLHEAIVIDADYGYQPGSEIKGIIKLKAGKHPFNFSALKVGTTVPTLTLKWNSAGSLPQEISDTAFSH
ncbi:arylsulfatase [Abditibacteriota bacterium]|nr:arylsulfatase [Abditibacteriota bacterium]